MNKICILVMMGVLVGCFSPGVKESRYKFESTELNDSNSGVVIGHIPPRPGGGGRGISFTRVDGQEEVTYRAAKTYCIRLPPGKYTVSGVATRSGFLGSNDPFMFDVEAGKVIYIGTLVFKGAHSHTYDLTNADIVSEKPYQLLSWQLFGPDFLDGPEWWFLSIDRVDDVARDYKKDCPGVSLNSIESHVMR